MAALGNNRPWRPLLPDGPREASSVSGGRRRSSVTSSGDQSQDQSRPEKQVGVCRHPWAADLPRTPCGRGNPRARGQVCRGLPPSHGSTPPSLASRQSPLCETTCRLSVCALAEVVVSTLETER